MVSSFRAARVAVPVALLVPVLLLAVSQSASAQQAVFSDSTAAGANTDGTINAGEYSADVTGINTGFGDKLGSTSRLLIESDSTGNLFFALQANGSEFTTGVDNDHLVIYLDTTTGGFASTEALIDTGGGADQGRAAASGNGTAGGQSILQFAPGFEADFAIVADANGTASLFQLGTPSHTFVANFANVSITGTVPDNFEFSGITMANLGLAAGDSFKYVATLINAQNGFRADEFNGVSAGSVVGGNVGNNEIRLFANDFNVFYSFSPTAVYVTSNLDFIAAPPAGTLRHAIINASPNAEIRFAVPNGTTISLVAGMNITQSLSIIGTTSPGLTLDGGDVNGNNLSITGGAGVTLIGLTIQNCAAANGGGIFIDDSSVTIDRCTISGNQSTGDGGGIYVGGASDVLIANSTIDNNTLSGNRGAGIGSEVGNSATITVVNSTISGNTGAAFGGAFYYNGTGDIEFVNCTIASNSATLEGGGVKIDQATTLTLSNTLIADNTAPTDADLQISGVGTTTANHNLIENGSGHTITDGANGNIVGTDPALQSLEDNGGPTRTHAFGAASRARDAGDNALVTTFVSTDQRNDTQIKNGTVDIGSLEMGLVVYRTDDGNISGTLRQAIADAAATDAILFASSLGGQTITLTANLDLASTDFSKDLAYDASTVGGIVIDGGAAFHCLIPGGRTITIDRFTFQNGSAASGGALFIDESTVTIEDCEFVSNVATGFAGGAIYINNAAIVQIMRCTFRGNQAPHGGGVMIDGGPFGPATVTIADSTFSGNMATTNDGGGIHANNVGTLTVRNCTIAGNSAANSGGGFIRSVGSATFTNTIIADNTATTGPDASFAASVTATNTLIEDASGHTITNGIDGNIVGTDPMLGTLGANGGPTQTQLLQAGSPAINAGTNAGVSTTDQRGLTRILGGTVDMGAVEYYKAVINEVVTDPQQDWSTNGFDGTVALGVVSDVDEWLEIRVTYAGANFTGWTIELIDGTDVIGSLAAGGAFDVQQFFGAGSFTDARGGDYLVLGNVAGAGAMNNSITIILKDSFGTVIDQVILGGAGNAPNGNASAVGDEAVGRIPDGTDTDADSADFFQIPATLGSANRFPPAISNLIASQSFQENTVNAGAQILDSAITVTDLDFDDFDGGSVTVTYSAGGGAEDNLSINDEGNGAGQIGVSGANVSFGGTFIGTITGNGLAGADLVVALNSNATPAAVERLLENLAYQNSSDSPTASRTIAITVSDGVSTPGVPSSMVITVTAENDLPQLGNISTSLSLNENTINVAPQTIDSGATLADVDSADFDTGNLTVAYTVGGADSLETLSIENQGSGAGQIGVSGNTVSYEGTAIGTITTDGTAGQNLVVTLNASATLIAVKALVEAVQYQNADDSPAASRTIAFTVNDGDGGTSSPQSVIIGITAENDAPVLDNAPNTALGDIAEGAPAPTGAVGTLVSALVSTATNVTEPDGGATTGIAITAADTANGTWHFSLDGGTNWSAMPAPSGANARLLAADADNRVYFQPNAVFNGSIDPALTFRAWDTTSGTDGGTADTSTNGGATAFSAATETASQNVTAVNDAPVIATPGGSVNVTENDAATILDATATVSDIDSADFDTGNLTVSFTANGTANDRLAINDEGTGAGQIGVSGTNVSFGGTTIGTFAGGTDGSTPLVISLNANATPAAVQALMRNITYANVSDDPATAARTVSFVLDDGDGDSSAPATVTVNLTAVNDAPTVAVPGSQGAPINGSVTLSSGGANAMSVADVDAGANAVQITLTATDGTATLAGTANLTFSTGDGTADASMVFTGTLADVNAALDGLTFTPTAGFTGTANLQIAIDDQGNTGSGGALTDTGSVTINVLNGPDIDVERIANTPIADGATDSFTGNLNAGTPAYLSYTIRNAGTAALNLSGTPLVAISNVVNGSVAVLIDPAAQIAANANTAFLVRVVPTTAGSPVTFDVAIANDDADENPYNFGFSATVTAAPDIQATFGGLNLLNGGSVDVGEIPSGTGTTRGFTVENVGTATLAFDSTSTTFADLRNCAVAITTALPATIAASGSAPLDLTITPTTAGAYSFMLVLNSDDPDEDPHMVLVRGQAVASAVPDIAVEFFAGENIGNGGATDLGTSATGTNTSFTWAIFNRGAAALTLSNAQITDETNVTVAVVTQPSANLAAEGATQVGLDVNPVADGAFSFTLTIPSNDPDEGSFTIAVSGTGTSTAAGDIRLHLAGGADVADNGTVDAGGVEVGQPKAVPIFIANAGTAALTVTDIKFKDLSNCTVTLPTSPVKTYQPGERQLVPLVVHPTAAGAVSFTVVLGSDDGDENPFTFSVTSPGQIPHIVITRDGQPVTLDGSDAFGEQSADGGVFTARYTISNVGNGALIITAGPLVTAQTGCDVTVHVPTNFTIQPGGSATFDVFLSPDTKGNFSATVRVETNDPAHPDVTITVTGTGISTDGCAIAPDGQPAWLMLVVLLLPMVALRLRRRKLAPMRA